jgi:hypothetical protein
VKIESQDRTVDELLNAAYFKVPRFQRPYSWERAEVEDFGMTRLPTLTVNTLSVPSSFFPIPKEY